MTHQVLHPVLTRGALALVRLLTWTSCGPMLILAGDWLARMNSEIKRNMYLRE